MDRKYNDIEDTEYEEVEILTNAVHTSDIRTASVRKRTRVCGFKPEMWKKQYPGLKTDYFSNIQKYCQEKDLDEDKINKEVLNLAIEVAQQAHSTVTFHDEKKRIENWIKKMESQKELPFIK